MLLVVQASLLLSVVCLLTFPLPGGCGILRGFEVMLERICARVPRTAQRQECWSLTLLLLSERAPSSWRDCSCTWALGTALLELLCPFPWKLLLAVCVGRHRCIVCTAARHPRHGGTAAFPRFGASNHKSASWSFSPSVLSPFLSLCL